MIYTCYFSGLGSWAGSAVSVCLQQPPRFRLPVAEELCPPAGMMWKFMKGKMSEKKFSQLYSMRFGVIDPEEIAERYDGKVLTSWEGLNRDGTQKFSHRHLIAEWLRNNGFECEELRNEKK